MMKEILSLHEEKDIFCLVASLVPEGLPFLQAHGCVVQPQPFGATVTFPRGSCKVPLSPTSRVCSMILLSDGTIITVMDCGTKDILLLIDPVHGHCMYLST